jgi:hypothetical protein
MVLVGKPERKRPLGRPRYRWVDNIRLDEWGEWVYRVLVGKPEGKRPLGRTRHKCVDNIWMDLREENVYGLFGEAGMKETTGE